MQAPPEELPAWGDSLVVRFRADPPSWFRDRVEGFEPAEVRLLAWRTHEQSCRDEITQVLIWTRLERGAEHRWAVASLMRWPPAGERWPEDRHRRWVRSASPYHEDESWLWLERPPTNEDLHDLWDSSHFGRGGWPVLAGAVHVETWRTVAGEEPVYTEMMLSPPGADSCLGEPSRR